MAIIDDTDTYQRSGTIVRRESMVSANQGDGFNSFRGPTSQRLSIASSNWDKNSDNSS